MNLEIITVYNEGIGGGGTGGVINVNTKLNNIGTSSIDELEVTIIMFNSSYSEIEKLASTDNYLSPYEDQELKLNFIGNHYETYHIKLNLVFNSNGKDYNKTYLYDTHEDPMNIKFEDEIFEWGF